MEENQITCPQCGLVNNVLADACVQCGIIFVKDSAMKATAVAQDGEKAKSIEEAEAILDETQLDAAEVAQATQEETQTMTKSAPVYVGNEKIKRLDPHEDTVVIRVPKPEELSEIEAASLEAEILDPDGSQDEVTAEIELEAIETSMETITEPDDTEKPVLTDAKADDTTIAATAEMADKPAEPAIDLQKAADDAIETDKKDSVAIDQQVTKVDDTAATDSKSDSTTVDPTQDKSVPSEPENKPSDSAVLAEAEPMESADITPIKDETQPEDPEIILEAESELKTDAQDAVWKEAQEDAAKSQAAIDKKMEAEVNQEGQKARNEALKKQQEALLKAEARKKEEAAQAKAAALKKKKLAKAKADALKKQKAAQAKAEALKKKKATQAKALALKKQKSNQAKAEALKKQKAAQAKAEDTAENVEVAAGTQSNYVKLLGLLKRYKGKAIGINYDNSAEIKEAELVEANEEFFSVMVKEKKIQYSYPLKTILTIVEGEQGVETGEDDKKTKFDAVIKVYPLVLF